MNGAQLLCDVLKRQGVKHLFAFPGGQIALLLSALRDRRINTIVATSESSAAFAALGYASSYARPGVIALIGGPGFSLALTALLEASSDSIPVVCLNFVRKQHENKKFHTQGVDHIALGMIACKQVIEIRSCAEINESLSQAFLAASSGQPGPVMVLVHSGVLQSENARTGNSQSGPELADTKISDVAAEIHGLLAQPGPTLLFAGRGTIAAAQQLLKVAEKFGTPVITTTSARGVIPENHELSVVTDLVPADLVNEFIDQFDRVIALGVRFSENSAKGFNLKIPPQKLVHIDASPDVVGANFASKPAYVADVPALLNALVSLSASLNIPEPVGVPNLADWRDRFSAGKSRRNDPVFHGVNPPTAEAFFSGLRGILPGNSIVVTDSGFHQMLVRKYLPVYQVNGLLVPTNFQSMGYGISTAIGAQLAHPDRPVVAVIGDGGLRMSGLEILTAIRQQLPITFVVFADGFYSEVRNQQTAFDGSSFGVDLVPMDYGAFANSIGIQVPGDAADPLTAIDKSVRSDKPALVIVSMGESAAAVYGRHKARLRSSARRALPQRVFNWLRRFRR